jgi:hypothetical protein
VREIEDVWKVAARQTNPLIELQLIDWKEVAGFTSDLLPADSGYHAILMLISKA